jgi:hypothetical protein
MRNIRTDTKAITKGAAAFIIIAIIAVIVIIAFASSSSPTETTPTNGLLITFDNNPVTWNDTIHQSLYWGQVAPSMSYTKNITVTNLNPSSVTLILLTTEPQGSHQTWPKNNTILLANRTTTADLTLTTETSITAGDYTWLLLASNSTTLITPTPSSSTGPTPTPKPIGQVTVAISGVGITAINFTNVGVGSILLLPTTMPYTQTFSIGATLKFTVYLDTGYTLNAFTFDDGTFPYSQTLTYTRDTNQSPQNFTITANALPIP